MRGLGGWIMPAKEINFYNISPYLRYIHVDDCIHGGYLIPWRQIYDYELVFVLSGNLHVKTERDEYTLTSGDVHIMPPFLRHTRYSDAPIYLYSLHFDLSYMGESNDFSCLEVYSAPIQKYLQQHTEIAVDERFIHRPYYSLSNVELPQKLEVSDTSVYVKILNQMLDVFDKKPFGFELDLKICILQLLRHIISDMHSKKKVSLAPWNLRIHRIAPNIF